MTERWLLACECGCTEWQLEQTKDGEVYSYMCAECGETIGD